MTDKVRRTHAERSAATKEKIIQAVVECISQEGIQNTTANAIAKRAGVTWGALQHHFGGKNGCLAAALEDSFKRFAATLGDLPQNNLSLAERINLFINRAWEHYRSPHYRSMIELILNDPSDIFVDEGWDKIQLQLFDSLDKVWLQFFPAELADAKKRLTISHYTHSVLTGLAMTVSLWPAGKKGEQYELTMLKNSLINAVAEQ